MPSAQTVPARQLLQEHPTRNKATNQKDMDRGMHFIPTKSQLRLDLISFLNLEELTVWKGTPCYWNKAENSIILIKTQVQICIVKAILIYIESTSLQHTWNKPSQNELIFVTELLNIPRTNKCKAISYFYSKFSHSMYISSENSFKIYFNEMQISTILIAVRLC